jgi:N-acyl-D-amino-acid deacylase
MGVTTLVTGNCGSSVTAVDSFLTLAATRPVALNIATLVGHNSVRHKVMGEANRGPPPTNSAGWRRWWKKACRTARWASPRA